MERRKEGRQGEVQGEITSLGIARGGDMGGRELRSEERLRVFEANLRVCAKGDVHASVVCVYTR